MKLAFRSSLLLAAMLFISLFTVLAQGKGEATFKQTCAAFHSIGKGKLVGPDLVNVQDRHTEEWLLKFIKSSQTMVKSGDKYADSLLSVDFFINDRSS